LNGGLGHAADGVAQRRADGDLEVRPRLATVGLQEGNDVRATTQIVRNTGERLGTLTNPVVAEEEW
jgi:hypothetical protein